MSAPTMEAGPGGHHPDDEVIAQMETQFLNRQELLDNHEADTRRPSAWSERVENAANRVGSLIGRALDRHAINKVHGEANRMDQAFDTRVAINAQTEQDTADLMNGDESLFSADYRERTPLNERLSAAKDTLRGWGRSAIEQVKSGYNAVNEAGNRGLDHIESGIERANNLVNVGIDGIRQQRDFARERSADRRAVRQAESDAQAERIQARATAKERIDAMLAERAEIKAAAERAEAAKRAATAEVAKARRQQQRREAVANVVDKGGEVYSNAKSKVKSFGRAAISFARRHGRGVVGAAKAAKAGYQTAAQNG